MIVHIVRTQDEGDWDAPMTKVTAVCKAVAFIAPDGSVIPNNFDFVGERPTCRHHVTCPGCLLGDTSEESQRIFEREERGYQSPAMKEPA